MLTLEQLLLGLNVHQTEYKNQSYYIISPADLENFLRHFHQIVAKHSYSAGVNRTMRSADHFAESEIKRVWGEKILQ